MIKYFTLIYLINNYVKKIDLNILYINIMIVYWYIGIKWEQVAVLF